LHFIASVNKKILKFLDYFIATLMFSLLIMVFFQVLNRFCLHIPAAWTEEMARYNFVWLSLFGSIKALQVKAHLSVDFFVSYLNPKLKVLTDILSELLTMIFCLILVKTGISYTISNIGVNCEFGAFPLYLIYAGVPVAGFLLFLVSLENLINHIYGLKR